MKAWRRTRQLPLRPLRRRQFSPSSVRSGDQAAPPPPPQKVTIRSGTVLAVRLVDRLDTTTTTVGQTFHATLDSSLSPEGEVRNAFAAMTSKATLWTSSAGKFAGQSELTLQLDRVSVGSKYYSISTDQWTKQGVSVARILQPKSGLARESEPLSGRLPAAVKGQPSVPPRAVDLAAASRRLPKDSRSNCLPKPVKLHPAGSGQCLCRLRARMRGAQAGS